MLKRIKGTLKMTFNAERKESTMQAKLRGVKRQGRLPALIRKHFFKKKGKGLDIMWLTAILNLEDKLEDMFKN